MNHNLPSLTTIVLLSLLSVFAAAQDAPPPQTVDGQRVVGEAAQHLWKLPSLQAKLRQRVDMFGHQLAGSGSYLQYADGNDRLLKMELKIQLADQVTSLQQVKNGRFLWTRREFPKATTLSRIDLRRVEKAIEERKSAAPLDPLTSWVALGGLPRLLQSLHEEFEFSPAEAKMIGEVPVWTVQGRWRAEKLAALLPKEKEAILAGDSDVLNRLPRHLPTGVALVLGRDKVLPLFPYRIEFLRHIPSDDPNVAPTAKPMLTLELFEVRRLANVDPSVFDYEPGDQDVVDHTGLFLQSLGLEKPDAAKP